MNSLQTAMLKAALEEAGMDEVYYVRSLPAPSQPRSALFEQSMSAICRQHSRHIPHSGRWWKRKWFAVLVAAVLLVSFSLSVSAIRKPIFSAFERIADRFVEIVFPAKQEESDIQEYQVNWVPEQFVQNSTISNHDMVSSTWIFEKQYITFTQYCSENHLHIDMEDVVISNAVLGDRELTCLKKYGTFHISWSEHGYFFSLTCPTDLPFEDICRMIESIRPVAQ